MKVNILLGLFGSLLGLAIALSAYLLLSNRTATHFNSIDSLHHALVVRDDRDAKSDQSVSLRSIIAPHPDKEIIYDLAPFLQVKFQGVPVRTNSCGMRGAEVAIQKPVRTYRIALLGDSFAFGWGVEEAQIFEQVLARELNKRLGTNGVTIEVLNFGVPGYSTFQEAAAFREKGMLFDPDLVLVYFIENDFGLPFFLGNPTQGDFLMSAVDFAERVWNTPQAHYQEEKQYLGKHLNPNRALAQLDRFLSERGIPLYLAINPGKNYAKIVANLGILRSGSAIRTIDIYDKVKERVTREHISPEKLRLPDDPHPSATKHQILGELLADQLEGEVARVIGNYSTKGVVRE